MKPEPNSENRANREILSLANKKCPVLFASEMSG
jgi:hypothetical protein